MNQILIAVFLFVVIVIGLVAAKFAKKHEENKALPDVYYLRKSLFTSAERSFFGVMESLEYEGLTITGKVRLADIFGVKKGLDQGDRLRAQNRINAKHVDFLLVQKSDGRPVLGIELDDRSHEEKDRAVRDAFVDTVFASAGLPILHVPVKQAYDPKEVHRLIDSAINQPTKQVNEAAH